MTRIHGSTPAGASLVRALLLLMLSAADVAFSQTITWNELGPEGGSFTVVATNSKNQIFVGTDGGGVFRSTDHGVTWTHTGLGGQAINAMAIGTDDQVFVGGYESSVWRSTDEGETWTLGDDGLGGLSVGSLAVDSDGRVFAGTGLYLDGVPGAGVFRSTDNGGHWTPVSANLADATITSLAVGPDGTLFAGAAGKGIYRSRDHGDTWVFTGLNGAVVVSLLVHPDGYVFAGMNVSTPPTPDRALYRSADGGDTWVNTGFSAIGAAVVDLAVNSGGDLLLADHRISRSSDHGANWTQITSGLTDLGINGIDVDSDGRVFASKNGEVARSTDNGENWEESRAGLRATRIRSIGFQAECLFVTGHNSTGISRSCDLGETWTDLGLRGNCVETVVANSKGAVFVGISPGCGGGAFQSGVLRLSGDGNDWAPASNEELMKSSILTLAMNSKGHLFAGSGNPTQPFDPTQGRMFRSVDDGDTWVELNTDSITSHIRSISFNAEDDLFAVAYNDADNGPADGLFRSTDNGETWVKLEVDADVPQAISAMDVDPSTGEIFIMLQKHGILRSADNGDSWQVYDSTVPANIVILAADKGNLFAGVADGRPLEPDRGVILFGEDGESWQTVNTGLNSQIVEALGISPTGFLFAGGVANGVFRSAKAICVQLAQPCAPPRRRAVRRPGQAGER